MSISNISCRSCNALNTRLAEQKELSGLLAKQLRQREHLCQELASELDKTKAQLSRREFEIRQLQRELESVKAQNTTLKRQVFGVKTEATPVKSIATVIQKRPKGKQVGTKGFGRFVRESLPLEDVAHSFDKPPFCSTCGAKYAPFPQAEISEEIHRETSIVRLRHFRPKAKKTCKCINTPTIITAPGTERLPKSLFSIDLITFLLIAKYHYQMPVNRLRKQLELEGLKVSSGTLTEVFKRIAKLVEPLRGKLEEAVTNAAQWQMDETRWKVFAEQEGKEGNDWWLWVTVTQKVNLFTLDPSRSAKVPQRLLKDAQAGVLTSDRYSAYRCLGDKVSNAWCWAHVRRDFIRLKDGYPEQASLAEHWIDNIRQLYQLNKARLSEEAESEEFLKQEQKLKDLLDCMKEEFSQALKEASLHAGVRKVFESLERHWAGLRLFADLPGIPMDNNASERALRQPVIARKASYGSGSKWSGEFAATMFSLFQTLEKNKADPRLWLIEYLKACARNKGQPPDDLSPHIPWDEKPLKLQPELLAV